MLVSQWTHSPVLGFILGATSHYIMDAIPHGDEFLYWRHKHLKKDALSLLVPAVDLLALLLLVTSVMFFHVEDPELNIALLAATGGVAPDLLMIIGPVGQGLTHPGKGPLRHLWFFVLRLMQIHWDIHKLFHDTVKTPIRFRTGIIYQAIFLLLFIRFYVLGG